jgi:hypothetical protein
VQFTDESAITSQQWSFGGSALPPQRGARYATGPAINTTSPTPAAPDTGASQYFAQTWFGEDDQPPFSPLVAAAGAVYSEAPSPAPTAAPRHLRLLRQHRWPPPAPVWAPRLGMTGDPPCRVNYSTVTPSHSHTIGA